VGLRRIAVYAGSFDPPTLGHLDIVARVRDHFDELHIVVAASARKAALFSATERVELIKTALVSLKLNENVVVTQDPGLIVHYCQKVSSKTLIRGLRALSDFESELQMASMNRKLAPGVETMHIMTDEKYFFLSSTLVRELAAFQAPLKDLVPACVEKALQERFASGSQAQSKTRSS
jgi:pantetheine-phosphate adenylyltransferase